MLLRRITEHVKAQNWFAVGLDFLIVVVGVFIGLQVANWNESRSEIEDRRQLSIALIADLEATQNVMQERKAWSESVVEKGRAILSGLPESESAEDAGALIAELGNVFVKGKWDPITHTYEQALGSGELGLIGDLKLRLSLGRYVKQLDNIADQQADIVTQYYGQLEPFLVEHTDYYSVAWEGASEVLVETPFSTDAQALANRRDLSNLLNLKIELEQEVLTNLETALAQSSSLINELNALASQR